MTKLCLVISLLFRAVLSIGIITQSDLLKTFIPGDTVDLKCFISGTGGDYYNWFKLTVGQAPVMIVSLYLDSKDPTLYGEFDNNPRFSAEKNGDSFVLTISNAKPSDVGMYYCAARDYDGMIFGNGIFLMHKGAGSRNQHLTQQSVSESVQPGDSVTLNCTIHTEACAGEHSVYWFRHGSGESRPGIIYTHGDRSDQCEKSPEAGSPTQSCVYNLPKKNLSLSDAGTYYCAVASCGEILFGNGTKLDIQVPEHDSPFDMSPTVLALVVSNIVLGIVTLLLVWALCKNRDSRGRTDVPTSHGNQNQDSDVLNYAAVSFTPKNKSSSRTARKKTSRDDAVYSDVRYLQQQ